MHSLLAAEDTGINGNIYHIIAFIIVLQWVNFRRYIYLHIYNILHYIM